MGRSREEGTTDAAEGSPVRLAGERVAIVGRLAGMSRRDAQQLVRQHGGLIVDRPDAATTLVVVGEQDEVADISATAGELQPDARAAFEAGSLEIIGESQLWQQLGLVTHGQETQGLYTPPLLANLIGESTSTIRRWQRRGWLVPTHEVRRLAYFNFEEVATARRIQELLAAGLAPSAITKTLAALKRQLPDVRRPLAELSVVVQGKHLLVRGSGALVEPGGQLQFDFDASDAQEEATPPPAMLLDFAPRAESLPSLEELLAAAEQFEEAGQLRAAAEAYRTALAAGGPSAEICFLLAEALYQLGDLPAARERYYMAVELDETYVEARANLGCVLAELGEYELAVSALQGALALHDDYEDAHYHLGRTLDAMGRHEEAAQHWEAFLRLAPTSPWADEARGRLER
jgi:tetratricopeptide (TPR) repeat protein